MLPLLLLLSAPQDGVLEDVLLEETVVTAPRAAETITSTPAKVTVVTGAEILASGERSLPRALEKTAGVWIQETNMGGGAPIIRGLLGSQILILVDGIRINDSTTRLGPNQSLNTIDPAIVERVEILRGSASVLYGSDAIGGVISIWTRRRRAESQDPEEYWRFYQGAADIAYDTGCDGTRGDLDLSAAYGDHGIIAILGGFDYGNYEAGGEVTVPFTGYNGQGIFGAYEYALGKGQTVRITGRAHRDFNVPRTDKLIAGYGQSQPSNGDWRYVLQDRRGYAVSVTDDNPGPLAERVQLRLNLHTYVEERQIASTDFTSSSFQRDEVTTVGLGADWQRSLGEDHLLIWGFDTSIDDVDSTREDTDAGGTTAAAPNFAPGSRYARFGVFVQDEVFSFDPWFLTLGLRYSHFDFTFGKFESEERTAGDFGALTGAVEAAREVGEDLTFTASLAQGYRAPNLEDLANDGDFAGGTELSNPDLEPEESLTLDLALALEKEDWGAQASVFGTRIDDAIGRVLVDPGAPDQTGDETYRRENTGEVDLLGAELGGWRRLGDEESPYHLDGSMAYVYGWAKDPAFGTVPARRVPPLHGRLALRYTPEEPVFFYLPNARLSFNWAFSQDRLHPQDKADPRINPNGTDGWFTFDFDVWGEINQDVSWNVGLFNLFDQAYRVHGSGVDAPGRHLVVGMHLEF